MSFTSFSFWFIFPLIFVLYWVIPVKWNTWRKVFLLIVSYLLYMNWKPSFALVLLGVTLVTYLGGGQVLQLRDNSEERKVNKRKHLVWLFALLGLLPLLVFKYYSFLNDSISAGLSSVGLLFALPGLNWAIPIGISFFTFQAVGYMLDVYHGRVKAEKNLLDYLLFVSFFPQVMSGPISKADELLPQIKTPRKFDYEQGKQGLKYLLWGMFIKLVIADRLGLFVDTVYANYIHYNGPTCFVASIFYTLQIYCDFAGYSLIAIGIARTLGFNLINNFKRPYLATSITDFWRRWHISLTRWLTQQVYIPLGGSRCSKVRTYWNIFVTFLVSGIWHGANWTFIVWGCMHGVFQIVEKALGWQKYEGNSWVVKSIRIVTTFLLVNFAWVFFRMPSINDACTLIIRMFTVSGMPYLLDMGASSILFIGVSLPILLFKDFRDEFFRNRFLFLDTKLARWIAYICLFCMILTIGVLDGGQFIYVSF
ncbi:MAG: MBOAT family protein [Bacteroidetes bacterium]|nr:MBOAT family protein [Bacteroidota bacterium]